MQRGWHYIWLTCANFDFVTSLLPQALYNEYVHFKETEIPAKEVEKAQIEHLYKLLEVSKSHYMMGT